MQVCESDFSGQEARFRAVYLQELKAVSRFVGRQGVAQGDVADVVQETFLVAYQRFDDFDGVAPRAWLRAIAWRLCGNWRRTERRRGAALGSAQDIDVDTLAILDLGGPSEVAESSELERRIWRAIQRLTAEKRSALLLTAYEGHSHAKSARLLQTSRHTLASRLRAARYEVRCTLERARLIPKVEGRNRTELDEPLVLARDPAGHRAKGSKELGVAAEPGGERAREHVAPGAFVSETNVALNSLETREERECHAEPAVKRARELVFAEADLPSESA